MSNYLCFDVETIPGDPPFDESFVKYGNLKDPDKRQAKLAEFQKSWEEGPQANPDLAKMMSTDPTMCKVCCVSMFSRKGEKKEMKSLILREPDDEYAITWEFWDDVKTKYLNKIPLVSYNGIGFDMSVLRFRAMALDVPVDPFMYEDLTRKYHPNGHHDLMQILAAWDISRVKTLDYYLKRFNLGQKTGTGGQVYELYREGKLDAIGKYCEKDVEMTAALFERLQAWLVKGETNE